jgi:hypothetical protein
MITAAGVAATIALAAWCVRAIRRENHRQTRILQQFDHDHPVREPGFRRVEKEDE